jgi:hypothetical protein
LGGKIITFLQPKQVFNLLYEGNVDYDFSCEKENINDCIIDNIILKIKAIQKEATSKPATISEQNKIISALITSKNNPKVIIVTGNVNNTSIGLIKILSKPKTMATIIEVPKLSTRTPGK